VNASRWPPSDSRLRAIARGVAPLGALEHHVLEEVGDAEVLGGSSRAPVRTNDPDRDRPALGMRSVITLIPRGGWTCDRC